MFVATLPGFDHIIDTNTCPVAPVSQLHTLQDTSDHVLACRCCQPQSQRSRPPLRRAPSAVLRRSSGAPHLNPPLSSIPHPFCISLLNRILQQPHQRAMDKMGATARGRSAHMLPRIGDMALAVFWRHAGSPSSPVAYWHSAHWTGDPHPCYTLLQSAAFGDARTNEEEEGEFFVAPRPRPLRASLPPSPRMDPSGSPPPYRSPNAPRLGLSDELH